MFHHRPIAATLLASILAFLVSAPIAAHAQTVQAAQKPVLTTLHRFDGKNGANPYSTLTLGSDGNFYGTTFGGGIGSSGGRSTGTLFRMTPSGQFTTLHKFNGSDGQFPGALTEGESGTFYGTASGGDTYFGLTFRLRSDGQFQILRRFDADKDGISPGNLLLAPDGSFYGTASSGPFPPGEAGFSGVVFHMTPNGKVTALHKFDNSGNGEGATPSGKIAFGPDGALYGVTSDGGPTSFGVVYRVTTGGKFSVLHAFHANEGARPSGVTLGPDGSLYGTTISGGINDGGVAYKITPSGKFTLLHKFSQDGHGTSPSTLTLGPDGNFYGTTNRGGFGETDELHTGRGTVFMMTPSGQVTTLYKFHTASDGFYPNDVSFGPNGLLYGTTSKGGTMGYGTLFSLSVSIPAN